MVHYLIKKWAQTAMANFATRQKNYKLIFCKNCHERKLYNRPDDVTEFDKCPQCEKTPNKFSKLNHMVPSFASPLYQN